MRRYNALPKLFAAYQRRKQNNMTGQYGADGIMENRECAWDME